jgi:hypothetical protein
VSSFREYLQFGWKLCNIPPGNKGPVGEAAKGWQKKARAITDPNMGPAMAGAGLLHAWSGTCALDIDKFDVAEAWLAERGVNLRELLTARNCVQISSGREGRYKLLYLMPTPLASKKLAPYKAMSPTTNKEQTYHGLELRCANADGESLQDVLPPTIHPQTGRPYAWSYGDDLTGDWRNLPEIPPELLALWHSTLEAAPAVGPTAPSGAAASEIDALLAQQDPDCDYDQWIKVGAAVHHETRGSADGLQAWDTWSAKGSKYKGRADLEAHWRSFRADANNAVTLGSLRREAAAPLDAFPTVEPAKAPEKTAAELEKEGWEQVRLLLEPRLVFVPGQDCYFDLGTRGEPWLSDRSVRHMFCPQMPVITQESKDGKPAKSSKPDPVVFLQNSKSKQIVDAVGIHPGAGRIYKEDGKTYANRYFQRKVELLPPLPHEEEAFLFLWSRIKDATMQRWLMAFFAHAVQKPGVKIQSAPLLYSAETGTGKNTICNVIPQILFGPQWVRTISGSVLASQFNDTVGETWWLYLEELRSGNSKPERVATTNKLKAWITDNVIEVHPKGLKPYNMRNRIQVTGTSNFDDAVQLDNNDRRWAVGEMHDSISEADAANIYGFLNSERAPGVLQYIFRKTNITGFNPTARAPTTVAKVSMIRAGIGSWESMLIEQMVQGRAPFDKDIFRLQDAYEALVGRGPVSQHALRGVLTRAPFHCEQLPNGSKLRLYAWRNTEHWRTQPESARSRYLETGQRPIHLNWSDDVPHSILMMSADGIPEKTTCDLL